MQISKNEKRQQCTYIQTTYYYNLKTNVTNETTKRKKTAGSLWNKKSLCAARYTAHFFWRKGGINTLWGKLTISAAAADWLALKLRMMMMMMGVWILVIVWWYDNILYILCMFQYCLLCFLFVSICHLLCRSLCIHFIISLLIAYFFLFLFFLLFAESLSEKIAFSSAKLEFIPLFNLFTHINLIYYVKCNFLSPVNSYEVEKLCNK